MSAAAPAPPATPPAERRRGVHPAPVVIAVTLVLGLPYFLAAPGPLRLCAKAVPVLGLAGWVSVGGRGGYARRIVSALGWSALGDMLLEGGLFLHGMAAFALAHVTYVVAFTLRRPAGRLARAAPFALWGAVGLALLGPRLGPLALPVAVYVLLLCAMMWRAAAAAGPDHPGSVWAAAGAVLFGVSDSLIAGDRFAGPVPALSAPILVLYWAGQAAIAASAVTRRSSEENAPADAGRREG